MSYLINILDIIGNGAVGWASLVFVSFVVVRFSEEWIYKNVGVKNIFRREIAKDSDIADLYSVIYYQKFAYITTPDVIDKCKEILSKNGLIVDPIQGVNFLRASKDDVALKLIVCPHYPMAVVSFSIVGSQRKKSTIDKVGISLSEDFRKEAKIIADRIYADVDYSKFKDMNLNGWYHNVGIGDFASVKDFEKKTVTILQRLGFRVEVFADQIVGFRSFELIGVGIFDPKNGRYIITVCGFSLPTLDGLARNIKQDGRSVINYLNLLRYIEDAF